MNDHSNKPHGPIRYLNTILSINAVLLAGLLWTQIAGTSLLDSPAHAQASNPPEQTFANPIKQRKEMIDILRATRSSIDSLKKKIDDAEFKVQVTNFDELSIGD